MGVSMQNPTEALEPIPASLMRESRRSKEARNDPNDTWENREKHKSALDTRGPPKHTPPPSAADPVDFRPPFDGDANRKHPLDA